MASAEPIISIDHVRFGYTATPVLDKVSVGLKPGALTVMVGPNAAGKTTLMKLMLGLVQPWSGKVQIEGRSVGVLSSMERARRMSYVPQRPGVRFAFTVRQVVAMGAHGHGRRSIGKRVDEAIEQAGLGDVADRVMVELSGGQQQRVLLARAELQLSFAGLAMLLDEPGSHLDLQHRHGMMRRLRALAESGLAVLVVLHELDLAVRYAHEAWLLDSGRLAAAGPWDQVLTPEVLQPVYGLNLERINRGGARPLLAVADATMAHAFPDSVPAD
ncbi:MAG: ABC transporter ATP-binding protein [Planctomycetota bacterium]